MLKEKLPSEWEVIAILSGFGLYLVIDTDNMSAKIALLKKPSSSKKAFSSSFLP